MWTKQIVEEKKTTVFLFHEQKKVVLETESGGVVVEIMNVYFDSSLFTECKFKTKMKEPFKFDLGVLNFKELNVNCEIAKKRSDSDALARGDKSPQRSNSKRCYSKYIPDRAFKILSSRLISNIYASFPWN